jgi:penicillin amidase
VFIVAALGVSIYLYGRRSLPIVDGTITVAGLTAPIEIVRDVDAIPHIFASTKLDALFGLGYVHAQDRLWQMEFQRRIGHGRLSEVFGEITVPQDRFLRTVGFGRAARAAWDRLPPEVRGQIDAYLGGVNAFLAGRPPLPPEFALLRVEPEPWTGPDVLVWVKMMAWDLSANYSFELLRRDLLARVGPERTAQLLPAYPDDGLSIVQGGLHHASSSARAPFSAPASAQAGARSGVGVGRAFRLAESAPHSWADAFAQALTGDERVHRMLLGGTRAEAVGSNNWVVDGTLTATGKPLLANDPHLDTHVPSLWYLAHMSAGDFEVIGATLPGAPAVAIGRNRFIAWGETNVAADVEDLFQERLDPTGRFAEFRGELEPLRIVPETIEVNGSEPVRFDVRISRHGPLVSDAINAEAAESGSPRPAVEPLALRWTALDDEDTTVTAFLLLNEARNWNEFTGALRHLVVPAQNFVYADVEGHIGYYAPARIPIRARGDGAVPAEGWTGDMEWTGWVPFEELPHAYDPPEHYIVTANHRPMPAAYPHFIALEYPNPYRAQRIVELIGLMGPLTVDDFRVMQADTMSLHARELLPVLLDRTVAGGDQDRRALDLLRGWNFDAGRDSAAAAIFQAWFLRLAGQIAGDELGPQLLRGYRGRFSHVTRFVMNTLADDTSRWCDDVGTEPTESCEQAISRALGEAVRDLTVRLGPHMTSWRWDAVHRAVFPHQGLDIPALRPLLGRTVPNGGDFSTVNVGAVDPGQPFDQRSIPGYRQIVDLSAANDSRFIDAVGQSGHVLSRHYDHFLGDWGDVRHRKMRMSRQEIERGALGRLRLVP